MELREKCVPIIILSEPSWNNKGSCPIGKPSWNNKGSFPIGKPSWNN